MLTLSDITLKDSIAGVKAEAAEKEKNTAVKAGTDRHKEAVLYEVAEKIGSADLDRLTPMEAMFLLNELREKLIK